MLSTIERDIYVIDKCYAKPIYYKQGTNAISLKFNFKDYTIPTGSVAKAYVNKPSGKATYLTATITEDNAVIVKPKTQMFSEDGKSGLHIKITKNEDVLMSFEYTINVEKNPIAGEVPPSENESDMMDSMLELLKIEVNKATLQATQTVQAEGAKQVQAVQTAAQEIIADREQIQKNKTDIASLTQNTADAIINTASGEHIVVGDSSGHLLDNLKIYGKSIQNGEPTPDNPVPIVSTGDKGKIDIGIHGKQLFDASKIHTKSQGGATVTNNGDGSFTISGSGTLTGFYSSYFEISHKKIIEILKVGKISVKNNDSTPRLCVYLYYESSTKYYTLIDSSKDYCDVTNEMLSHPDCILRFYFYGHRGATIKPGTVKPMLYQDGDGTWEPYAPLQSLSVPIPMPDNLRGAPVESGGNYADATGQQWVSDVIDLKRGKWTQCIDKIILNGTEDFALQSMNTHGIANFAFKLPKAAENKIAISNYFKKQYTVIADTTTEGFMIAGGCSLYIRVKQERADTVEKLKEWLKTHNVTVIYGLAKPIEKDIPQEALTAYKKLHSNYPSTVVQNTEGAGMELSYVADTKNYTDNKIKEAVSAQTQSLANLLSLMPLSTQAAMIETDTNNILDNMEVEK